MTYESLGEVSIELCQPDVELDQRNIWCSLILGPTGSGKSTFIEALAGMGRSLRISSNQLEGFTREVTGYKVRHAFLVPDSVDNDKNTRPVYLIDTPGFSDNKISSVEVVNKAKKWMSDHGIRRVNHIFYLCPINITRLAGSKRKIIQMLNSLLLNNSEDNLTIITTMWDQLQPTHRGWFGSSENQQAERNFEQFRDVIWKDSLIKGAKIVKFQNTRDSAIAIIKLAIESFDEEFVPPFFSTNIRTQDPCAPWLYEDLLQRINTMQHKNRVLQEQQIQLITRPGPMRKHWQDVELFVLSELREVEQSSIDLLEQLTAFGDPPPGFEGVPESVIKAASEEKEALEFALDQLSPPPEELDSLPEGLPTASISPEPITVPSRTTFVDRLRSGFKYAKAKLFRIRFKRGA